MRRTACMRRRRRRSIGRRKSCKQEGWHTFIGRHRLVTWGFSFPLCFCLGLGFSFGRSWGICLMMIRGMNRNCAKEIWFTCPYKGRQKGR